MSAVEKAALLPPTLTIWRHCASDFRYRRVTFWPGQAEMEMTVTKSWSSHNRHPDVYQNLGSNNNVEPPSVQQCATQAKNLECNPKKKQ